MRISTGSPLRQPLAVIGGTILSIWILIALFAPLLAPSNPVAEKYGQLVAPNIHNWFGTDSVGRDVLSRVV